MKHLIITSALVLLSSSCVFDSTILVETKPRTLTTPSTPFASNFSLSNVQLINNQFVFTGTNLNDVTSVKINDGGVETVLDIESKNTNQIIANTLSNVSLAAEKVLDFILSDAQAASTFTVDFTLCNTLVAGVGFNCSITPVDKDLMIYDSVSGKWSPGAAHWTTTVGGDLYRLTGNVGIGVAGPAEKLEVNGNVKTTGIFFSSDRGLKKEVRLLAGSAEKILGLRGVEYKWRVEEYPERNFDNSVHFGFIAQDVAKIFPHLVKGNEGNLSVDYTGLIAPMVEVLKTQDKKILLLEKEVQVLKNENIKQSQLLNILLKKVELLEKR